MPVRDKLVCPKRRIGRTSYLHFERAPQRKALNNPHIPTKHKNQGSLLQTISNSGYGKQDQAM